MGEFDDVGGGRHRCPRCGEPVTLSVKDRNIQAHEDELVAAPCPIRAMSIDQAWRRIDEERAKVGLPPQKKVAHAA